jgi:hypothetical protein
MPNVVRRRLPVVSHFGLDLHDAVWLKAQHPYRCNGNVGTQLPFGGLVSAAYEPPRGPPKQDSSEEKQAREKHQQRVRDLKSIAVERRPELGSLLAALFSIGMGFIACGFGMGRWDAGRRMIGGFWLGLGLALGCSAPIGLLLGWGMFWKLL